MQPQPVAEEDSAAAIAPPLRPSMPRFLDGLEGVVDMSALIASPNAGVFARLADSGAFDRAFVALGAVC
jgi:hypothetical protein